MLAVFLSLACTAAIAQTKDDRPKLYASLSETIQIDKNIFANVLDATEGKDISVRMSEGFTFSGTVISNFTKYNNLHTVMVRSNENTGSVLQITLIKEDNNISYSGRILNNNAADGFEIKNKNGEYYLQKFETIKILEPCKL